MCASLKVTMRTLVDPERPFAEKEDAVVKMIRLRAIEHANTKMKAIATNKSTTTEHLTVDVAGKVFQMTRNGEPVMPASMAAETSDHDTEREPNAESDAGPDPL